jgi:hypothetical protein
MTNVIAFEPRRQEAPALQLEFVELRLSDDFSIFDLDRLRSLKPRAP